MYFRENDFTIIDSVQKIAEKRGVTNAQIALAWMLNKSHITAPIIGASKMEHLDQAIAALDIALSGDEVFSLDLLKKDTTKIPKQIQELVRQREQARKEKNFKISDDIRKKINLLGYHISDTKEGQKINKA